MKFAAPMKFAAQALELARKSLALAVFAVICAGALAITAPSPASATVVSSIQVDGNQRVDDDTVIAYMVLQPGQTYTASAADESLKALFATGLFEDVSISLSGRTVLVVVVENPLINRVAFEGNSRLEDSALGAAVESQPRSMLTRAKVQADVQRILQLYRARGRFGARVEPKIIDLPDNRVNLVFEIDEADKTSVRRINFIGNQAFGDGTLRDVITTSERNFLSWLNSRDVYDPDRLEADQELLRRFYLSQGYADFRVISAVADFDRERNAFFITITVDEGERYRFGAIDIESNVPDIDAEVLRGTVHPREGDTYNVEEVDKTLEDLTFELATSGYAFAQVRPRGFRDVDTRTIDITFVIDEGPRAYIERINIRGNTRTQDTVIRREFDFAEGDAFNQVMLDRAERRLDALRYFESTSLTVEPGSAPDRVIINVAVVEQPTGEFSAGAGYSTSDGFIGEVSISERNFLGRGQFVRIALGFGEERQSFDFSFTEPYFTGRRVSFGFDVYSRQRDDVNDSGFDTDTLGGGIRFGLPLNDDLTLNLSTQVFERDVQVSGDLDRSPVGNFAGAEDRDLDGDGILDSTVSRAIRQIDGDVTYAVLGYDLVYNTVDSTRRPSNGLYLKFGQALGYAAEQNLSSIAGDVSYLRTDVEGRLYEEIRADYIAMLKVEGGYIASIGDGDVLLTDSYFKGGETIRGFKRAGIGPRDLTTGDSLGGKFFASATAELTFPVAFLPDELGFRGAIFADAGILTSPGLTGLPACVTNVPATPATGCVASDSSIRSSVGFGLLWDSPFGPLRADFGIPLTKEDYDETEIFRFGAGARF